MANILIGTASWTDPGFLKDWYPKSVPAAERLTWYAEHFNTVEVNSTFYALPRVSTVQRWVEQTPDDFIFDIKLPKLFSWHSQEYAALPYAVKALAQPNARGKVERTPELVAAFTLELIDILQPLQDAGKLGLLLLQLSPAFAPDKHSLDELRELIPLLPARVAVEFRHDGWLQPERLHKTLNLLTATKAVFVNLDAPQGPQPILMPKVTAVTCEQEAYLRCHGRDADAFVHGKSVAERFNYEYSEAELTAIAERAQQLSRQAGRVHVIFNNNRSNYAPKAAEQLRQIIR